MGLSWPVNGERDDHHDHLPICPIWPNEWLNIVNSGTSGVHMRNAYIWDSWTNILQALFFFSELPRPIVKEQYGHLPIWPIWDYPWTSILPRLNIPIITIH